MRDPARISRVLRLLEELWKRQPDLRLTQLVVNAADTGVPCPELYQLEDDALEKNLQKEASKPPIVILKL